jgi:hypothetical protein
MTMTAAEAIAEIDAVTVRHISEIRAELGVDSETIEREIAAMLHRRASVCVALIACARRGGEPLH